MADVVITAILWLAGVAWTAPVDTPQVSPYASVLKILIIRSSHQRTPVDLSTPPKAPRKYEKFADNAIYLGFNTVKIGLGLGMLTLVLTVTERLARWLYRHVRGSIQYWKDEIQDMKNGGVDPNHVGWDKDEFVNEPDGWQSDYLKPTNRTALFRKNRNPRPVKWTIG